MRIAILSLLALSVAAFPACKEADPNAFETHTAAIEKAETRAEGFGGLQRLVKSIAGANNEERAKEFGEKVIPVFEAVWDDAPEFRPQMLEMTRDMGRAEAAPLWNRAIVLDGSAETHKGALVALQGIRDSKAAASLDAIIEQLDKTITDPSKDKGELEGQMRLEYAKTLGVLGDAKAVDVLIKLLGQPVESQPTSVHREAAKALGMIGDPRAVDHLLAATLRVPDQASTTDVFNRSMLALVAIGGDAVDPTLKMFRGENKGALEAAAVQGVDDNGVKMIASQFLGALADARATEDLVAFMPKEDCAPDAEPDPEAGALRMTIARQLGFIGDEKAVDALCACSLASHNHDMFEIAQALGWIGGDKAVDCLAKVMTEGEYSLDAVASSDFRYEIRWDAARFGVLAASAENIGKINTALAANKDPKVAQEMAIWEPAIAMVEECQKDSGCYLKRLQDASADWPVREKAAIEVARLNPGNLELAEEVAKGFKIRNPDARVTAAIMARRMAQGKRCQPCAEAIRSVLKGEKGTMDAKMQLGVLKARHTIAALSEKGSGEDEG
jgi:HEAT repeat protein